ncbi:MAG: tRNA 2-thiouridine(34) synthase MnmA [Ruminococcaceae bacterium]|nr:tRNA 2-thiouridine(34) synthase MnmA [Oscillospiraceae bacterium]
MEEKKILLGMSGGIDSTYAVTELRKLGYEVFGAFLKMTEESETESAVRAAEVLGVPLTVVDCTERFRDIVIENFLSEYAKARTPNPCIVCNRFVKIAALCETAKAMGIEKVATGHYAKIGFDEESGRYCVCKAADPRKDQSYMLWRLTQEQLSMLEFPLGSLLKSEIKEKAQEMALPNADAPESQEICFIPSDDYVSYIEERKGKFPEGDFKDENGKTLGRHGGIIRYTVGQRKGLGVSLGKPAFVMAIDPALHTVTLTSDESKIFTDSLTCNELNFMLLAPGEYETVLGEGKIRYAAKPETAEACIRNGTAEISFVRRVRAVTPGQSVVFYREGKILFGGMIE